MTEGTGWEVDAPTVDVDEDTPQLYYGSLPEFMREFFVKMFPRDVQYSPGMTWCPEWWQHPEATYRLESLWRSWEHLRLDPALGSSTWLREHLDHHLPILLSDSGPFKGCSIENGHSADRDYVFEIVEPPQDLFVDENS
jgi:hypothetical protein